MNVLVLSGNLCADPEMREVGGKKVGTLRLANNTRFGQKEETLFIDVEVWEKTAELCEKYLKKGRSVLVKGRLKMDTWEKDGVKNTKFKLVNADVEFGARPEENGGENGENSETAHPVSDSPKPKSRKKQEKKEEEVPF